MSDESAPSGRAHADPRPSTPLDRLAAVDAELESLDSMGLADQVAAFDRMHAALTSALAVTVDQPGPVAGGSGQPSLPYGDR
jgi:hypothetical protein